MDPGSSPGVTETGAGVDGGDWGNIHRYSAIDDVPMTALSTAPAPMDVAPPLPRSRLGDLLVNQGKLTARDLDRALNARDETGSVLEQVLVNLGLVSEGDVTQALAELLQLPFVAAEEFPDVMPEVEGLQPDFLRTHLIYPLKLDESGLSLAMAVADDPFALKALRLATGQRIHPCVANPSDIEKALSSQDEPEREDDDDELGTDVGDFVEHLRDLASEAPVIRLVNLIIGRVIDILPTQIQHIAVIPSEASKGDGVGGKFNKSNGGRSCSRSWTTDNIAVGIGSHFGCGKKFVARNSI